MKDLIKTKAFIIIDKNKNPNLGDRIYKQSLIVSFIDILITLIIIITAKSEIFVSIIMIIAIIILFIVACINYNKNYDYIDKYKIPGELKISYYENNMRITFKSLDNDLININIGSLLNNNVIKWHFNKNALVVSRRKIRLYYNHKYIECGIKIICQNIKLASLLDEMGYNVKYIDAKLLDI